ncbi:hypothetical protein BJX70DRAFT_395332 [Aspergillus crustosus]
MSNPDRPFHMRVTFIVNEARPMPAYEGQTWALTPGRKPVVIQGPVPLEQANGNFAENVAVTIQEYLYMFMAVDSRLWSWSEYPTVDGPRDFRYASVLVEFPEDVVFPPVDIGLMMGDLPFRGKWWEILEPGPDQTRKEFFDQWHSNVYALRGVPFDGEQSLFDPIPGPPPEGL